MSYVHANCLPDGSVQLTGLDVNNQTFNVRISPLDALDLGPELEAAGVKSARNTLTRDHRDKRDDSMTLDPPERT